jgi:hypothetical protein
MTLIASNNYGECKKLPFNKSTMNKHQQRKNQPVFTGVLKYFPDALKAVSECSLAGNTQHHPDKELHWDKSKSFDNEDALVRHLIDHSINPIDDDGMLHLTKCAWRALASLQIYLENNEQ